MSSGKPDNSEEIVARLQIALEELTSINETLGGEEFTELALDPGDAGMATLHARAESTQRTLAQAHLETNKIMTKLTGMLLQVAAITTEAGKSAVTAARRGPTAILRKEVQKLLLTHYTNEKQTAIVVPVEEPPPASEDTQAALLAARGALPPQRSISGTGTLPSWTTSGDNQPLSIVVGTPEQAPKRKYLKYKQKYLNLKNNCNK